MKTVTAPKRSAETVAPKRSRTPAAFVTAVTRSGLSAVKGVLRPVKVRLQPIWAKARPFLGPVLAKAGKVLAVVRPLGWGALAVAAAACLIGVAFKWHELMVAALFLAVAQVSAVYFVLGRFAYEVEVDMTRLRVRVDDDAFGGLTVRNTSDRRLLPAAFHLPVGKMVQVFDVGRLAGHESFYEPFQVDTSRRGVVNLGPVSSSRGDGLGLLRRDQIWTEVQELFIHPKTVSLADSSAGLIKDLEGRPTDTLSSSDIAFHALRDYVVGDDLRHVHWKTSARIGKLVVRQFEETRRSHLVVCLSCKLEDYASEEDFELAVSAAASLGQQAIIQERDLTIAVPGHQLNTLSAMRMLDDFSRLELAARTLPIEMVALEASGEVPDVSVAIMISGTPVPPARLHGSMIRFGVDVMTVSLRCEVGAALGRSAIGSSPVLTIGKLEDLPRVLRSLEV
ncbi:MAG: DUF58 domain-containing protein [Propionibacteriaceae bacterium]|nr:DUF58 domain-containing protein [Propionibacteriaceae bacterium]